MRPSAIRRTAPCAASSLSERANRWAKRSAGSPVIRKLMTVLLGNFEPPLERDPRRLSFRFLLSNSSTPPPSAAQCAARLGVRTALDYDRSKRATLAIGTATCGRSDGHTAREECRRGRDDGRAAARTAECRPVRTRRHDRECWSERRTPESADLVLDLRGHILLPGLINCH